METIKCKKCGTEFDSELEECPNCQTPTSYSRDFGVPYYSTAAAKIHNHRNLRRGIGIASIILSIFTVPVYTFWAIYAPVEFSFQTSDWVGTFQAVTQSSNAITLAAVLWLFAGIAMIAMSDIKAKYSYFIPSVICLASAIAQLFAIKIYRIGAIWSMITFGFAAFYCILVLWKEK